LITAGSFVPTGGTSAAAPAFAGIVTLLNQYLTTTGAQRVPGLGDINPMLYGLAQNAPAAFHDITTGSNIVPCVIHSTQDCTTGSMGLSGRTGVRPRDGTRVGRRLQSGARLARGYLEKRSPGNYAVHDRDHRKSRPFNLSLMIAKALSTPELFRQGFISPPTGMFPPRTALL
jgi:hypothetical protein